MDFSQHIKVVQPKYDMSEDLDQFKYELTNKKLNTHLAIFHSCKWPKIPLHTYGKKADPQRQIKMI